MFINKITFLLLFSILSGFSYSQKLPDTISYKSAGEKYIEYSIHRNDTLLLVKRVNPANGDKPENLSFKLKKIADSTVFNTKVTGSGFTRFLDTLQTGLKDSILFVIKKLKPREYLTLISSDKSNIPASGITGPPVDPTSTQPVIRKRSILTDIVLIAIAFFTGAIIMHFVYRLKRKHPTPEKSTSDGKDAQLIGKLKAEFEIKEKTHTLEKAIDQVIKQWNETQAKKNSEILNLSNELNKTKINAKNLEIRNQEKDTETQQLTLNLSMLEDRVKTIEAELAGEKAGMQEFKSDASLIFENYYTRLKTDIEHGIYQTEDELIKAALICLIQAAFHSFSLFAIIEGTRYNDSDCKNRKILHGEYAAPLNTVDSTTPFSSMPRLTDTIIKLLTKHNIRKLDNVLILDYKIG